MNKKFFKYISLNIVSSLHLIDKLIKHKDEMFNCIIANISIKRNDELVLTEDNLKLICFRLYSLGYEQFNINIFSKVNYNNIIVKKININELLSKIDDKYVINKNIKYNINYININYLLDDNFVKLILKSDIANICIFENMS